MSSKVRTRFAPSPTGFLHVGGVRTAIFAWLTAKQSSGEFVLRIEDTDQKRKVEGAEEHIIESLAWLNIKSDEPLIRQSDRVKDGIYKKWAEKLIENGRAYADPYTPEEVQKFREQAQTDKKPFLYRNNRPENPPKWDGKTPLRFKAEPKEYVTHDEVMGEIKTSPEVIDDFILIKSDGFPTYNFAHIVDDLEMGITHVIRGQEFLASLPNYRNLYEALGKKEPVFVTVPHILNEQGNKKLSKRDGAKDILEYREQGYLPEAMMNFLATLGWNDGTEQEIFAPQELLQKFQLEQIQKGSAHFDEKRLEWISGHHIRTKPLDELYELVKDFWPQAAKNYDDNYKKKVLELVQERMKFFAELPELTQFFFEDLPVNPELVTGHKQLKKLSNDELESLLEKAKETLEQSDFSREDLQERLNQLLETSSQKPIVLFSLIRISTTQAPASPGLAETLEVIGKETAIKRIAKQLKAL
ncbi:MAG TPA: glutamate--tRNA ligase [Candidatus Saccharimonadales bacterium]|nr:glutamate--tRNA ligase [Candidatus Saccharimonadales bacterium]